MAKIINRQNKKHDVEKRTKEVVDAYLSKDSLKTDPNGSYTGKGIDKFEKPIQDADDL